MRACVFVCAVFPSACSRQESRINRTIAARAPSNIGLVFVSRIFGNAAFVHQQQTVIVAQLFVNVDPLLSLFIDVWPIV